jgi:GT2 family glycosyltransferase
MATEPPAPPRLLASIVSHNSVEALQACLQSLVDETRDLECEIWVVDNFCEQRAAAAVRDRFPAVNVIENRATLGLSANHNQVLLRRAQDVDFVLLLNPDVVLYPQSVAQLMAVMAAYPDAAACGPQLVNTDGDLQPTRRHAIKPLRDTLLTCAYVSNVDPDRLRGLTRRRRGPALIGTGAPVKAPTRSGAGGSEDLPEPVAVVSGACVLLRSSALAAIGAYDERFFLYFAETDWCLRAVQQGWRVYHVPHVRVLHEGGVSTRPAYTRYLQVYAESAVKLYHKHCSWWVAAAMGTAVSGVACANFVRWTLRSRLRTTERADLDPWIRLSRALPGAMWGALQPGVRPPRRPVMV